MANEGCSHCGRHAEERALVCPDCGLSMPTRGQRRRIQNEKNVLGVAAFWVGLVWYMAENISGRPLSPLSPGFCVMMVGIVTTRAIWMGWRKGMTSRMTRYLPCYPAILLVPTILAFWAWFSLVYQKETPYFKAGWGYPLRCYGWFSVRTFRFSDTWSHGFRVTPFVIDLALALAVAVLLALAVDRMVLAKIRAVGHGK